MVSEADALVADTLGPYLEAHGSLSLAVASRELLVDGKPAPAGAVAKELAIRLHQLNIGAVRMHPGMSREAISTFVALLARRAADVRPHDPFPDMPGIAVGRLDFDALGLADQASVQTASTQLWRTLAQRVLAAMGADAGSGADAEGSTPTTLGAALSHASANDGAARQAFEALHGMAEQVRMAPRRVQHEIGDQLQALLSATEQSAMVSALRAGSGDSRARLVANMVDVLPAAAVVQWLNSAAKASGRDLSPHLLRLLSKMSVHFRGRRPDVAAEELRAAARELVEDWNLAEPNPAEHALFLDTLALWSAHGEGHAGSGRDATLDPRTAEASRLVQMAIEIDVVSEDLSLAVQRLADDGHTAAVLSWIERSASPALGHRLRSLMLTPASMLQVLLATPFDAVEAQRLLDATPADACDVLLEALERCESRTGRRLIFDRLRTMPSSIATDVCARLSRPTPWFLARNLLALLRDLSLADPEVVERLTPGPLLSFQRHERAAVRREAVRLLVQFPAARAAALRRALDDATPDVQHTAIDAAYAWRSQPWAPDVAQRLLGLAANDALDVALREKALRAVGATVIPEVRSWLLAHVSRRSALRSAAKLAAITPTVRAALQLLASRWNNDAEAQPVLTLARKANLVGGEA
jgi:hypothetical protein